MGILGNSAAGESLSVKRKQPEMIRTIHTEHTQKQNPFSYSGIPVCVYVWYVSLTLYFYSEEESDDRNLFL